MNEYELETLYLDDITGCLGEWFGWNTSDIPDEVMEKLHEAYELATKTQAKGVK